MMEAIFFGLFLLAFMLGYCFHMGTASYRSFRYRLGRARSIAEMLGIVFGIKLEPVKDNVEATVSESEEHFAFGIDDIDEDESLEEEACSSETCGEHGEHCPNPCGMYENKEDAESEGDGLAVWTSNILDYEDEADSLDDEEMTPEEEATCNPEVCGAYGSDHCGVCARDDDCMIQKIAACDPETYAEPCSARTVEVEQADGSTKQFTVSVPAKFIPINHNKLLNHEGHIQHIIDTLKEAIRRCIFESIVPFDKMQPWAADILMGRAPARFPLVAKCWERDSSSNRIRLVIGKLSKLIDIKSESDLHVQHGDEFYDPYIQWEAVQEASDFDYIARNILCLMRDGTWKVEVGVHDSIVHLESPSEEEELDFFQKLNLEMDQQEVMKERAEVVAIQEKKIRHNQRINQLSLLFNSPFSLNASSQFIKVPIAQLMAPIGILSPAPELEATVKHVKWLIDRIHEKYAFYNIDTTMSYCFKISAIWSRSYDGTIRIAICSQKIAEAYLERVLSDEGKDGYSIQQDVSLFSFAKELAAASLKKADAKVWHGIHLLVHESLSDPEVMEAFYKAVAERSQTTTNVDESEEYQVHEIKEKQDRIIKSGIMNKETACPTTLDVSFDMYLVQWSKTKPQWAIFKEPFEWLKENDEYCRRTKHYVSDASFMIVHHPRENDDLIFDLTIDHQSKFDSRFGFTKPQPRKKALDDHDKVKQLYNCPKDKSFNLLEKLKELDLINNKGGGIVALPEYLWWNTSIQEMVRFLMFFIGCGATFHLKPFSTNGGNMDTTENSQSSQSNKSHGDSIIKGFFVDDDEFIKNRKIYQKPDFIPYSSSIENWLINHISAVSQEGYHLCRKEGLNKKTFRCCVLWRKASFSDRQEGSLIYTEGVRVMLCGQSVMQDPMLNPSRDRLSVGSFRIRKDNPVEDETDESTGGHEEFRWEEVDWKQVLVQEDRLLSEIVQNLVSVCSTDSNKNRLIWVEVHPSIADYANKTTAAKDDLESILELTSDSSPSKMPEMYSKTASNISHWLLEYIHKMTGKWTTTDLIVGAVWFQFEDRITLRLTGSSALKTLVEFRQIVHDNGCWQEQPGSYRMFFPFPIEDDDPYRKTDMVQVNIPLRVIVENLRILALKVEHEINVEIRFDAEYIELSKGTES